MLDLTRLLPGPLATLRLAELGADVLKIEPPGEGDYARSMLQSDADRASGAPSAFYRIVNRGKRSLTLDLKTEAGRAKLIELARDADVLVESFRPTVMTRLGVGYDVLRQVNPKLVYCAITGFGSEGAFADKAGHDLNYIAYAGVLDQLANGDGAPIVPNFQLADLLGGALAAVTQMLAALWHVARGGEGRFLDVSMTHAVHAHNVMAHIALANADEPGTRAGAGLLNGGVPCYNVYRTADDKFVAVGALELKFWQTLCGALGRQVGRAALESRAGHRRRGCEGTDGAPRRVHPRAHARRMDGAPRTARLLRRAGAHAGGSGGASALSRRRLTSRQGLTRLTLVVDEHVLAARDVTANGRDDFGLGHVRGHDAPRNLPFAIDPFDDPASAAERLLQGRRDAAAAQMECWGGPGCFDMFQSVILSIHPVTSARRRVVASSAGPGSQKDMKTAPAPGYSGARFSYGPLPRVRSVHSRSRTRSMASSIRSTAITLRPSTACFGALAFGISATEKPSLAASFRRSCPRGDGRISPASPTSPNVMRPFGRGLLRIDE